MSVTSYGIALENQHLNGTSYLNDRDKTPAKILNHKKLKFEPQMLGWLAIKDFTEKGQYPKSRIFTFFKPTRLRAD
jgi:hypothetical protein